MEDAPKVLTSAAHRRSHMLRVLSAPGRRELAAFGAVYLLYDAARWVFAGRLAVARAHGRWVIHLERAAHLAVEGSVQRALDWSVASFVLSNIYLAAQLAVLPGALIWLYHRSPAIYRRLRNTMIGTWLIATPIFAIYPVAPPRLAGIGLKDTVSHQAAVALTGHSTIFYNPYAAVPSLPFGGVGDSGFGRIHGDDGLREFSRAKATTSLRFPLPVDLLSFDRPQAAVRAVKAITKLRHGRAR